MQFLSAGAPYARAVTFSRVGDPATGDFQDTTMLTQFWGDADVLSG
jgi:hypothetical protein